MEHSKFYIQQQEQEKQSLKKPCSRASAVFGKDSHCLNVEQLTGKTLWTDLYGHK